MKYTKSLIDELIGKYGAEYFYNHERFYRSMVACLEDDDPTHYLSKYFQVYLRYLWMQKGIIRPKDKEGDQLLFTKGPAYVMSRFTTQVIEDKELIKHTYKEQTILYRQNAQIYRAKLKHVEKKFNTKYPFTCGICEKREKRGIGFYTRCEEFFLCEDCIKKYQINQNIANQPIIYSTPMGGASIYRMKNRRK